MLKKAFSQLLYCCIFICVSEIVSAQNMTRSPYSSVGVGDIQFLGNAQQLSMGQVSQAIRDPYGINNLNPASYAAIKQTILEAGLMYANGTMQTITSSNGFENYSFSYFSLGIPVSRKLDLGAVFGLQPYSNIGYNLKGLASSSATTGMQGSGGITRFYIGSGMRVYKNLSAGFNVSYLFGTLTTEQQLIAPENSNQFNLAEEQNLRVGDLNYQLGLQYNKALKNDYIFTAGVSYALGSKLGATRNYTVRTVLEDATTTIDTVVHREGEKGALQLPYFLRGGIALEKKEKWLFAVDANFSNWESFRVFGQSDSLKNCLGMNAGLQFIPDMNNMKNFLNRIEYRIGGRFDNGMLVAYDKNIIQYGVSAGLGLPLGGKTRRTKSKLNLSFEYFIRGTRSNNLIREEYFRMTLGVSFGDTWFRRYRYD